MLGGVRKPPALRGLTLANLAANTGIVITGGAVRLTGSGLGCPTWPKCTEDSYVPSGALGVHEVIEFGNRTLSVLVGVIAFLTLLAAWRRPQRRLALWVFGGVLLQGIVGGLTVRFELSPYLVGPHFLFSMVLIALSYELFAGTRQSPLNAQRRLRPLAWAVAAASAVVLFVGVVVTGSGPHAGDETAVRTGFDPQLVSQLHADSVFLLLGLTIAMWLAARALAATATARACAILLAVILAQGLIGFVQYFSGLPIILVGAHLAGACATWIATLHLFTTTRAPATVSPPPAQAPAAAAKADAVPLG